MLTLVGYATQFTELEASFYKMQKEINAIDKRKYKQLAAEFFNENPNPNNDSQEKSIEECYEQIVYAIALYAKVPEQYIDNVLVEKSKRSSTLNVYFNKKDRPTIDKKRHSHGHIMINKYGEITYFRNVNGKHGRQNFTNNDRHPMLLPISLKPMT